MTDISGCGSIMEELLENEWLDFIVKIISSFLDAKSLAQCRLVCQSYRNLIDNDRQWLIFQLEHIQKQKNLCEGTDFSRLYRIPKVAPLPEFEEGNPNCPVYNFRRFPEWNVVVQKFSRKHLKVERICQAYVVLPEWWIDKLLQKFFR